MEVREHEWKETIKERSVFTIIIHFQEIQFRIDCSPSIGSFWRPKE